MQGRNPSNPENPFTQLYYKIISHPSFMWTVQSPYTERTIRTFVPPFIVSWVNFPGQLATANQQLGRPWWEGFRNNPHLAEGYKNSLLGSIYKNFALSHRDWFNEWLNGDEDVRNNGFFENAKLVAGVSVVDTVSTQYFANRGKQLAQKLEIPTFDTYGKMLKYGRAAFWTRLGRNSIGIAGFIGTDPIQNYIESAFPSQKYGYLGFILSHIATGTFTGISTMFGDYVWSHQLFKMNMTNYDVPTARSVIHHHWKTYGPAAFFRGTWPNVIAMTFGYLILTGFNQGMQQVYPKNRKIKAEPVAATLFAPATPASGAQSATPVDVSQAAKKI